MTLSSNWQRSFIDDYVSWRVALLIAWWSQWSEAYQGMFLNVFASTAKKMVAACPCFLFPWCYFFFGSCTEQNKSTVTFLDFVFVLTPPLLLMEKWHGELQIPFFFLNIVETALSSTSCRSTCFCRSYLLGWCLSCSKTWVLSWRSFILML